MTQTQDLLRRIIRTAPVQQRSSERIELLLDAAAAIIAETGVDGLTTSLVAARAHSSVGVVYRYFPNIGSLLQALTVRNIERYVGRLASALRPGLEGWAPALDATLDIFVDMMRNEPGFRWLRLGDLVPERLLDTDGASGGMLAQLYLSMLSEHFEVQATPEAVFKIEVAVEIADGLMRRAFAYDAHGDERFIERTRELMHAELEPIRAMIPR
ncbi:TetR family transcriptional regulator [Ruicaihuangia caeni]|uniref:TetR/AcrR family transcriptional regulator n=1 Tax=Ruicaihuangia caeni TaxID=3042517 RepID=A0AAW6T5R1_9MICO|nr:TetR/AcrR family transcriptional regulator [Klugiella sp. YN-L-19]MDI2097708.1 TetR/AcrR family transcriptional regulator [Klugiella sp. YN-L-19]